MIISEDQRRLVLGASGKDGEQLRHIYVSGPSAFPKPEFLEVHEYEGVVLLDEESEEAVGGLSPDELHSKIAEYWPEEHMIFLKKLPVYDSWLSYFTRYNQDFGVVHAWCAAIMIQRAYETRQQDKSELMRDTFKNIDVRFDPAPAYDEDAAQIHGIIAPPPLRHTQSDQQGHKIIVSNLSDLRPRRIWDICANKVVPSTWFPRDPTNTAWYPRIPDLSPISHAWVAGEDLEFITTPVNNKLWPVPLPRGVTLSQVRQGLIEQGVRYSWLDVLCLRQHIKTTELSSIGADAPTSSLLIIMEREKARLEEWQTDVPLIGMVYPDSPEVIVYLNGLGRPFINDAWSDSRHWCRRAWTLQETLTPHRMKFAGLQAGSPDPYDCEIDEQGTTLREHLTYAEEVFTVDVDNMLRELKPRYASNPVDKVAALATLFGILQVLPVYHPTETADKAWIRLMSALALHGIKPAANLEHDTALRLLECFPYPSTDYWFPSWAQISEYPDNLLREPELSNRRQPKTDYGIRVHSGRLYRGCFISQIRTDATSGQPVYLLSSSDPDCPPCEVKVSNPTNPAGPRLSLVDGENYVILDVTLHVFYLVNQQYDAGVTPPNTLLLCKELSPWVPPNSLELSSQSTSAAPITSKNTYRLRRLVTLEWESGIVAEKPVPLPFPITLDSVVTHEYNNLAKDMHWDADEFEMYLN